MEEIKCEQVGMLSGDSWDKCHETNRRVYSSNGLSPTITTMGGGQREPKIIEPICLNSKVEGKQPSLTDRVYDTDGISPCVTTSPFFMGNIAEPTAYDEQNGYLRQDGCVGTLTTDGSSPKHNNRIVETIKCIEINIPQTVKVRKYEVDIEKLKQVLKAHKKLTNKEIANQLNVPITKVEHWFRRDKSFAIPDASIWFALKELLKIETDEFDKSIMEYIEKPNEFDMSNRAYLNTGIAPTITCGGDSNIVEPNYELSDAMKRYINAEHDKYKVSGGNLLVNRDIACAKTTREGSTRADASDYISPDLPENANVAGKDLVKYRIRKLTPGECFRLMGVKEDDYIKVSKNQSISSQYHLAGDSIVTTCLMAILGELLSVDYKTKINELVEELKQ